VFSGSLLLNGRSGENGSPVSARPLPEGALFLSNQQKNPAAKRQGSCIQSCQLPN
jgi:hypothetical protein